MRKENTYRAAFRKLLLQSAATLLLFLFIEDTLKAPLSWPGSDRQSYELCDHLVGEEEPLGDTESQKKEKKKSFEEFIPSIKNSFTTPMGIYHFPSFFYKQNFKSRVNDRISPPPKVA